METRINLLFFQNQLPNGTCRIVGNHLQTSVHFGRALMPSILSIWSAKVVFLRYTLVLPDPEDCVSKDLAH